jgi:hypothetical protein
MRRRSTMLAATTWITGVALLAAAPAYADRKPRPDRKPSREGAAIAQHSLRAPVTDEEFYFVMADRFENADPANDTGGLGDDRLVSGFDPTSKGFYNGGDLKGLLSRLDYIEGLGTDSIWLTPSFKNKAVQLEDGRPPATTGTGSPTSRGSTRTSAQRGPRRAGGRRARAGHEGLLRHHHQPHR